MELGFWAKLQRPILALAPMANVTNAAFRRLIAKYSKPAGPDVMFTEFVSADGLSVALRPARSRNAGGSLGEGESAGTKLLVDLLYSESERPIVAQLFSGNPEKMFEAAKLVKQLGFDGLDINMGCPDRSVEKSGAGAALIKNPKLARVIIRAAKAGLMYSTSNSEMYCTSIPVSIKTRLGYNKDTLEEWLPELLAEKPAALTIHARTRKEMSTVPAHWGRIRDAVRIRDSFGSRTLILGNGDVASIAEAKQKVKETGADGIMLGRAIFGQPWLFAGGGKRSDLFPDSRSDLEEPPIQSRLRVMVEHARLFEELFWPKPPKAVGRTDSAAESVLGKHKSFAIMKKHFKAYAQGFEGAKELRIRLMETESAKQVEEIVMDFLKTRNRACFSPLPRTNLCT